MRVGQGGDRRWREEICNNFSSFVGNDENRCEGVEVWTNYMCYKLCWTLNSSKRGRPRKRVHSPIISAIVALICCCPFAMRVHLCICLITPEMGLLRELGAQALIYGYHVISCTDCNVNEVWPMREVGKILIFQNVSPTVLLHPVWDCKGKTVGLCLVAQLHVLSIQCN